MRSAIRSIDREVRLSEVVTGEGLIAEELTQPRFYLVLLTGFATFALALAALGLYGALAYGVRQRTREISVRIALGASLSDVRALVVRQGLAPAGIGLGVGLVLSVAVTRVMRSLLYETGPANPMTIAAVVLVVAGTALLATYLPARRAARVDPIEALRAE